MADRGRTASRIALWVALMLLGGVGLVGYWATAAVVDTTNWVDHTHDIIETLEAYRTNMSDAEVAGLSYCVTADDSLLPGYESALKRMNDAAKTSEHVTHDTRRAREFRALVPLVQKHFEELDQAIAVTRELGAGTATIPSSNREVVAHLSALIVETRVLLDERESQTAKSVLYARIAQGVGAAASFLLFLYSLRRIRRYEKQIEASQEERFRAAIEGSLNAFYLFDAVRDVNGTIIDFIYRDLNLRAAKRVGHPIEVLRGRRLTDFFPMTQMRPLIDAYRAVVETQRAKEEDLFVDFQQLGVQWIHHQIVPLGDGVAVTSADIGDRKREEEALRASEERFRLFLDGVRDHALFMLDPEMQIMSWNAGAERILGYSTDEVIGKHVRVIARTMDEAQLGQIGRVALSAGRHDIEGLRIRKDSSEFWASIVTTPIHDGEGAHRGYSVIVRDLTERHLLEEQLRQSQKLEAIGHLAGGIAHDFNNVLSVILTFCALVLDDLPADSPIRTDIEEIKTAGNRAVDLVRQLLAFSRRQVLEPRLVDLSVSVRSSERMLRRLIGEDIRLQVDVASMPKVMVDPGQIDQVLMNLVVNARDAMPRGGAVTIETKDVLLDEAFAAEHEGVKPGMHVMLAVSDTGTGMNEETKRRIFEPFFTTKGVGKGTGLGLATVFGIVRQSEGTIWVESELGKGTTFRVYFPVANKRESVSAPPVHAPESLRGRETILLVEDEKVVREVTQRTLERYGYNVITARDGSDALDVSAKIEETIDLVLTDVVMPNMGGRELAEKLEVARPGIRVLYMSGYTDDAVVRHGISDRSLAFIQKPLVPDAVARKLRAMLSD